MLNIREKMMSRMRSIKVLDHALSTPMGLRNCERFVEIFGLKTLFAAFMRKVNVYMGIFVFQPGFRHIC
jgi:beta-catenin-like protein 1